MSLIQLKQINKYFGSGENKVHILKDINLEIEKGDFISIIGTSGSGKTTLMNILGCLDTSTTGQYILDNQDIGPLDGDSLSDLRQQKFGFIFQRYNLLTSIDALDNVALPAIYAGISPQERHLRAAQLLEKLDLGNKLHNKPSELSGGQQQRVSIARALMNGGEIIFADEPTGALDSKSGKNVMSILQGLHAEGHTIILVTHDREVAHYANRIIEIKDGEIISDERSDNVIVKKEIKRNIKRNLFSFYKGQIIESFKMSISAIFAHKMRSLLTMLGIIIGITSVVSVVAIGNGTQQKILSNINSLGTNTMAIFNGTGFGDRFAQKYQNLTISDLNILSELPYVQNATPSNTVRGSITYGNNDLEAQIQGVGSQYFAVKGIEPTSGQLFDQLDVKDNAQVAVIDQNTQHELFPNSNPIGKIIMINMQPLRIIGTVNTANMIGIQSSSLNVWLPYTTAMYKIYGGNKINSIIVKIKDNVNTQAAEQGVTNILTVRHGKKDFFILNTDSIKQTIQSTTDSMKLLIACIAVISLIVGGIGVMNIMLVSVTERTREIGIRMAIGARRNNILLQFLIEATLICLIGGLLGIALSYGVAGVFNSLISSFSMTLSTFSIVTAVLCSTLIGIIFGYIPARNASKLNPITALSFE